VPFISLMVFYLLHVVYLAADVYVLQQHVAYVHIHYNNETVVVFDEYSNGPNAEDFER
jgi:hypothetical protein